MKQTLNVEAGNYQIIITDDSFDSFTSGLNAFTSKQKRLFVVSKKVYKLYKEVLNLQNEAVLVLNDGEKEKNIKNLLKILEAANA